MRPLFLVLVLALAACGGQNDTTTTTLGETGQVPPADAIEVTITGVYWEGNLSTIGASWASEARFAFRDSNGLAGLFLTPGAGVNNPTPVGGLALAGGLKLEEAQIPDVVLADGILNLEFYESFVDNPGAPDAIWNSGTLRIQYNAVPAPAALAPLGLAGLAGTRRRRG